MNLFNFTPLLHRQRSAVVAGLCRAGVMAFALCFFAPAGADAALTRTYLANANAEWATSVTVNSLNVTAGDMIVVLGTYLCWCGQQDLTVSGSNMGTLSWTEVTLSSTPDAAITTSIFYAIVQTTTSSGSVTLTNATSSYGRFFLEVHKVSGSLGGVYGTGTTASNVGANGTISITLSQTPASGDVQLAVVGHQNSDDPAGGRFTPGSSFTEQTDIKAGTRFYTQSQYRTGSTSTACTWTLASGTDPRGEVAVAINIRDASVKRWDGGGADNNWSTSGNWDPDGEPASTDSVIFLGTGTGSPDKNCTLNGAKTVKAIVFKTDYTGTFDFSSNTLTVTGSTADFRSGGTITASTGTIAFTGTTGTQLFDIPSGQTFPAIQHTGAGTLQLTTNNLTCASFSNSAGVLDLNSRNITTTGNFTITNGSSSTFTNLAGRTITVGGSASFTGQSGNLLNLNPASTWNIPTTGTLTASYANVGYSNAGGGSQGSATNSTNSSNNTNWNFVVPEDYATWSHNKGFMLNTTSSGANVSGTVTNFPVLVRLNPATFDGFANTLAGGADIRFASSNGDQLSYEIERWVDGASNVDTADIWVLVPSIAGNNSTQYIRMHYGKSAVSSKSNGAAVFGNTTNFVGAWHMGDNAASTTVTNATGTHNGANQANTSTKTRSGIIGRALDFNGSSDYVQVTDHADFGLSSGVTMSCWVYTEDAGGEWRGAYVRGRDGSTANYHGFWRNNEATGKWLYHAGSQEKISVAGATVNGWSHLALSTIQGGKYVCYLNGAAIDSGTAASGEPVDGAHNLAIGRALGVSEYFDGAIDEVRWDKTIRSSDWIKLCYNNQKPLSITTNRLLQAAEDYSTWQFNRKVWLNTTSSGANVTGDVTNFPVLVRLTTGNFGTANFANTLAGGADIRFAKANGNRLDYEIERWADGSGNVDTAEIWVKVDTVHGDSLQYFEMFWGKGSVSSQSNPSAVFDTANGHQLVLHLEEEGNVAANGYVNATAYNQHATGYNLTGSSDIAGAVGKGQKLNGTNQYIRIDNDGMPVNPPGGFSTSMWLRRDGASAIDQTPAMERAYDDYCFYVKTDNNLHYVTKDDAFIEYTTTQALTASQWYLASLSYTPADDSLRVYLDGTRLSSLKANWGGFNHGANQSVYFGARNNGTEGFFNGAIDEIRIDKVTRSAHWHKLCYENQKESQTLVDLENYNDWSYSTNLVVNTSASGANVSSGVRDFPLLVRLNGDNFDLTQSQGSGGADMRFANADGDHLAYEIERWCTGCTPDSAEIWVRADTIKGNNSSQYIQMYWGRANVQSRSNPEGVFATDNGFVGVWHFKADGDSLKDATSNSNDGAMRGAGAGGSGNFGAIGESRTFDGSVNAIVNCGSSSTFELTNKMTLSGWYYLNNVSDIEADWAYIAVKRKSNWGRFYGIYFDDGSDYPGFAYITSSADAQLNGSTNSAKAGEWVYIATTYDDALSGKDAFLYQGAASTGFDTLRTALINGGSFSTDATAPKFYIGGQDFEARQWVGGLDEIRLSSVARDSNWLRLCYETQKPAASVVTFGSTRIWDGGGADNNFSTAGNWNPDGVPSGGDSLVFNGTSTKNCQLSDSALAKAVVFTSGYTGTFDFAGWRLGVSRTADWRTGGAITGTTGRLAFIGSGTQIFTPKAGATYPAIVKSGSGTLQLNDSLVCSGYTQTAGVLNFNSRNLRLANGSLSITGGSSALSNLGGRTITVVNGSAEFISLGTALNLNPGSGWTINVAGGKLIAEGATLQNSTASGVGGIAYNCTNGGSNTGWTFASKYFWHGATSNFNTATNWTTGRDGTGSNPANMSSPYVLSFGGTGTGADATCRMSANYTAQEVDFTGYSGTFSFDDDTLTVSGDVAFVPAMRIANATSPSTTPLVQLNLDDGSGTTTANSGSSSGTHPTATFNIIGGFPAWSTDIPSGTGYSVNFSNTGNDARRIETASAVTALANLTSFTITGWLKRSATSNFNQDRFVFWLNNAASAGIDLCWYNDGSIRIGLNAANDGMESNASSTGKVTAAGGWTFFAVTYDASLSSNALKFYFGNTSTEATLDVERSPSSRPPTIPAGGNFAIGNLNSNGPDWGNRTWYGGIDGIRVYGATSGATGVLSLEDIRLAQLGGTAATGGLRLSGSSGIQRFTPHTSDTLEFVLHSGAGTVQLDDSLVTKNFIQTAGVLDFNGNNIRAVTNISITNGTSSTMSNLGGRRLTAGGSITLAGQSGNLLNLNPSSTWYATAASSLSAQYATVKNSDASAGATGQPSNCGDERWNRNWNFPENYADWDNSSQIFIRTATAGVTADVAKFPLLVRLHGTHDFSNWNSPADGGDLRFSNATGAHLAYETERWVYNASGPDTADIWVLVDTVQGNDDAQYINMHYGRGGVYSKSDPDSVFSTSNGFAGVWHMGESPSGSAGAYKDATLNSNDLNARNSDFLPTRSSAIVGYGQQFTGDTTVLGIDDKATLTPSTLTVSCWTRADRLSGGIQQRLVHKNHSVDNWTSYNLRQGQSGSVEAFRFAANTAVTTGGVATYAPPGGVTTGVWYYLTGRFDGSRVRLFVNGSNAFTDSAALSGNLFDSDRPFYIGAQHHTPSAPPSQNWPYRGSIDEVRVESAVRSDSWIKLCYETQKPGANILSFAVPVSYLPITTRATAQVCSLWTNQWTLIFSNQAGDGGGIIWLSDTARAMHSNQLSSDLYQTIFGNLPNETTTSKGSFTIVDTNHAYARIRQNATLTGTTGSETDSVYVVNEYTVHGSGRMFVRTTVTNASSAAITANRLRLKVSRAVSGTSTNRLGAATPSACPYILISDNGSDQLDILFAVYDLLSTSNGYGASVNGHDAATAGSAGYDWNANYALGGLQSEVYSFMINFAHATWNDTTGVGRYVDDYRNPDTAMTYLAGTPGMELAWENSLRGHWSFDDATGTTVADVSGRGNHGTATGGSWVSGKWGISGDYALNVSDAQKVTVNYNSSLQRTTALSAMGWVTPDATVAAGDTLISMSSASSGFAVMGAAGGVVAAAVDNQTILTGSDALGTGTPRHVAFVWRQNGGTGRLYIDGRIDKMSQGNDPLTLNTANLVMGAGFDGKLDDFRLYLEDISDETIQMIANRGYRVANGLYQVRADNNNTAHLLINGTAVSRQFPVFQIANYWAPSTNGMQVWLDGAKLTKGSSAASGDYYAVLNDIHNQVTVALNKNISGVGRLYVDDTDSSGAYAGAPKAQLYYGVHSAAGNEYIWMKNFASNTFGSAGSKEFFLAWKLPGGMRGEPWLLQTSETNAGQTIDTTDQSKNQIPNANDPGWNTNPIGLNATQLAVGQESWTWDNATVDNGYAVVESSSVRMQIRINGRDVTRNGGTYYLATIWTVYPTGQFFRYDSLYSPNGNYSMIPKFNLARSASGSVVYLNSAGLRGGVHSTSGVKDFAAAFVKYRDNSGNYHVAFNNMSNSSSDDITTGSTGFEFTSNNAYFESGDFPIQMVFYMDISREDMSNAVIDSLGKGVQGVWYNAGDAITGTRVTNTHGDLNGDGWNELEGAYIIAAQNNEIALRIAARRDTCKWHPVVRVTNFTYTQKPRYVFLYSAADTVQLAEGYGYTMHLDRNINQLLFQLDTVLCDTSIVFLSADRTLAVTMSGFTAEPGDRKDTLFWSTESEYENLGFNIYRRVKPHFFDTLSAGMARDSAHGRDTTLAKAAALLVKRQYLRATDTIWSGPINGQLIAGAEGGVSYGKRLYKYIDHAVFNDVVYEYRLEAIDYRRAREWYGPVEVMPRKIVPQQFALHAAFPNPFRRVTTIKYDLPVATRLDLAIYTLDGRRVRHLIKPDRKIDAAFHRVVWDGNDDLGRPVAAGPYVYRLSAKAGFAKARVLVHVK